MAAYVLPLTHFHYRIFSTTWLVWFDVVCSNEMCVEELSIDASTSGWERTPLRWTNHAMFTPFSHTHPFSKSLFARPAPITDYDLKSVTMTSHLQSGFRMSQERPPSKRLSWTTIWAAIRCSTARRKATSASSSSTTSRSLAASSKKLTQPKHSSCVTSLMLTRNRSFVVVQVLARWRSERILSCWTQDQATSDAR